MADFFKFLGVPARIRRAGRSVSYRLSDAHGKQILDEGLARTTE